MGKAKSKRQTSNQKHKVLKKIREHKRDVRKAAKVMKASGMKVRSKKARESAKLALRVSNANPDKEKVLTALLASRQAGRDARAAKKVAALEERAAKKANKGLRGNKAAATDAEAASDDEAASDAESVGSVSTSSEVEGAEAKLFKRSRAELTTEGEKKLTSKQVAEREKQQRRADAAKASSDKQKAAISQHLLIPAGEHVGNTHLQFEKVVDRLGAEVPAFLVVLDARCALQSIPWEQLDSVVAAAVVVRDTLKAAEETEAKKGRLSSSSAAAASPAGKKAGGKRAAAAAAAAAAEEPVAAPAQKPNSASVQRLIMFILNKAELVPADTLALAFSHVAQAVKSRYGDLLVPAVVPATAGDVGAPSSLCSKAAAKCATAPVSFTCMPHSAVVDSTAKILLRALRQFQQDFVAPFDAHHGNANNMKGKLGCCVIGYPATGKTALCRALQRIGTDSVVATVPCRTIRTAVPKPTEGQSEADAAKGIKIIVPGAKQVTLVTIADDEKLKAAPIVAGDVVFHSESRLEKIKEPEAAALLLAESFKDQTALCQALSLPVMPTAAAFLKAFGRCIIREKGFQPSGIFEGSGGSQSSSALSASNAMGAAAYVSGMRKVHVRRRYRDGRNPLRVGARIFLKEFHEGRHIVWAVKRGVDHVDEAASSAADVSAAVNLMMPLHIPKPVVNLLSVDNEALAAAEVAKNPGAVALMVAQHALRDCMAMLPHRALEVDANAVVAPSLDEDSSSDDDDDVPEMDSDMSFEDEEGEGFSDLEEEEEGEEEESEDEA